MARFIPADVIDRELTRTRRVRQFERRWGWVPGMAAGGSFVVLLPWGLPSSLMGAFLVGATVFVWMWRRRAALEAGRDLGGK